MTATDIPDRVRWAVDLLAVRPADHILEIGCGPGHAVALIAKQLTRGTITAIDRSAVAVTRTRDRARDSIAAGRARVHQATLSDAELERRFHKAFAININAFWTTPAASIAALQRVLDPRGRAWLVYEPPSESRLRGIRESLARGLETNGFSMDRIETQRFRSGVGLAILARPR
jgi:cyclopropane fatty-acyl-phospholipid synthase-like methyltransferase